MFEKEKETGVPEADIALKRVNGRLLPVGCP